MEKTLYTLFVCFLSITIYAQENITNELKDAYQQEKYDLIISEHSKKVDEYPAKAIYYVAMAYYMKANDNKVLELMNKSIEKDKNDPDTYFIKGMTLNYMNQFDNAEKFIKKAIELDPSNPKYFSGLGDSFFNQKKYDKALSMYIKATEKNEHIDRPFTMIPQIYIELNQPQKALEAFYKSKEKISKQSNSYINTLYNIGVYEYLDEEYNKAELAFKELLELTPNDYPTIAKLIQAHYGKKEYDKAKPLIEKLYLAYKKGELNNSLKNMFCFDQFVYKDKRVLVFEKFPVKEGKLYYKHVFYVTDKKGEIAFTIQTENSPVSKELGGEKYAIGMDKNDVHYTFGFIKENFKYDKLKTIVIKILNKEIEPVSSFSKQGRSK